MPSVSLTSALRDEYQSLFDACIINSNKVSTVESILNKIRGNRSRYEDVGSSMNIPWYFIAVIHNMESSLNFDCHLHNGDPLTKRTTRVPAGRPKDGNPPFTWEQSSADALQMKNLHKWTDWSVPGLIYKIEEYNGWGYRLYHQHVLSPYLWSFSNLYTSGKYVADGRWSDTAASQQCGAAVLLRRLAERGEISFAGEPVIDASHEIEKPFLFYSNKEIKYGEELQKFLNQFPGIYLKVDGAPGDKTSEAFKKVTGYYLTGDPRA